MTESRFFEGPYRKLVNTAADRKGSIHDDAEAQKLGFRGGFVPGSVVGTATMPAIVEAFGKAWMEGGWYSLTFVSPVYIDDEVHEVAQRVGDDIAVQVVDRSGRLCCNGRAGLGAITPWDAAADGPTAPKASSPASRSDLSSSSTSSHLPPTFASAGRSAATRRHGSKIFALGRTIVPPEYLQVVALHLMREPHQPQTCASDRAFTAPARGPSTTSQ